MYNRLDQFSYIQSFRMNKIFKLNSQFNLFTLYHRLSFNRTEFKNSTFNLIQSSWEIFISRWRKKDPLILVIKKMFLKTALINQKSPTIYILWRSPFCYRNPSLWPYSSRNNKRRRLPIRFSNRSLRFKKIWMGLSWITSWILDW